jgi:hypothetical protein
MARSYGRLFCSIWDDGDFRPLSVGAKLMYGFLISQDDIEHSGIIGWRPARWARELGEPIEDVTAWCKELDQGRYVIIDEEAVELLVRSLIRRDDIWKQPNVFKAAASSAKASKSAPVKAALYYEIRRLTLVGTGRETHAIRDELLSHLEPFANHSPNPPEGFPKGSGDHSGGDTGSLAEPSGNGSGPVSVDNSGRSDESAGQNPSGMVREPLANHSAGPTGKGEGYGPVLVGANPHSPTPSPAGHREPSRPLWPSAVPDVQAEEGDSFQDDQPQDEPPDLAALVAEVREIRPDWASQSVRRAMASPVVRERPWPVARRAMVAVARDPASKHPGRIAGDGDWWHQPGSERATPERPPWCGQCDPDTRMLGMDTDKPSRCPRCKPEARAS